jgi:hypothetical protein
VLPLPLFLPGGKGNSEAFDIEDNSIKTKLSFQAARGELF